MSEDIVAQEAIEVKPRLAETCCVCGDPFAPGDEMQVLCDKCISLGIRCGCVMPWQSCSICEAVARVTNDGDELPF